MTQIEEKKMLAEFMGWIPNKYDGGKTYAKEVIVIGGIECADKWFMPLFNDFNSLMEVVEKINVIGFECIIYKNYVRIVDIDGDVIVYSGSAPMYSNIYRACVEFVKWWNEQQDKTK